MEAATGPSRRTSTNNSIQFGMMNQKGDFKGKTVAQIRDERAGLWTMPNDAKAFVGNRPVDENYELQDGDQLEFHRRAGEKG